MTEDDIALKIAHINRIRNLESENKLAEQITKLLNVK